MDLSLFSKYCPVIYKDENEPFPLKAIGCTSYTMSSKSVSSKFNIEFSKDTYKVLEYAFYWDYDIQHLYDLEHAFLYLNDKGDVIDVISSFHGKFYRQSHVNFEGSHPILYTQPGKHALMAHSEYFNLYVDLVSACSEKAGADGILVPEFIANKFIRTDIDDVLTENYIKDHFSFTPSFNYVKEKITDFMLTDWPTLLSNIPSYMKAAFNDIQG